MTKEEFDKKMVDVILEPLFISKVPDEDDDEDQCFVETSNTKITGERDEKE